MKSMGCPAYQQRRRVCADFQRAAVNTNGVRGTGSLSDSWTLLAVPTLSPLSPPSTITYDGTSDVTVWATGTASGSGNLPAPTGPVTAVFYAGTAATGTPLNASPIAAGTYTADLTYAGDANYTAATGAPVSFTINHAAATVSVTDAGGTFNGSTYPATATVNGTTSLEGFTPTITYYAGTAATGTPLTGAPSMAGTYTTAASFAGGRRLYRRQQHRHLPHQSEICGDQRHCQRCRRYLLRLSFPGDGHGQRRGQRGRRHSDGGLLQGHRRHWNPAWRFAQHGRHLYGRGKLRR